MLSSRVFFLFVEASICKAWQTKLLSVVFIFSTASFFPCALGILISIVVVFSFKILISEKESVVLSFLQEKIFRLKHQV